MIGEQNNMIFINVDDEKNIHSMHTLLFSKREVILNCCLNKAELLSMFMQIYSNTSWKKQTEIKPNIIVLLDHIMDG